MAPNSVCGGTALSGSDDLRSCLDSGKYSVKEDVVSEDWLMVGCRAGAPQERNFWIKL